MVIVVMAAMERGDSHGRNKCGESSNGERLGGNSCGLDTVGMVKVVEVTVVMIISSSSDETDGNGGLVETISGDTVMMPIMVISMVVSV